MPANGADVGVLLVNLGTPDAPDTGAVRRYLAEFLWDPRVIELPRPLWWLILHGVILIIRPPRAARAYRKIWTDEGSPLLAISRRQAQALQNDLAERIGSSAKVVLAMRYGRPTVAQGLDELRRWGAQRIVVLPMYPQYSATTTGSVFDAVSNELRRWRHLPEVRFINQYHDDAGYIRAMAARIRRHWNEHTRGDLLLFSFHGIPKRYVTSGDPYESECHRSADLLASELGLKEDQWRICFQSRFGREEWLQPYTDQTLKGLPGEGVTAVDIFCPGFAVDCLETLEEMAMENRDLFIEAGGDRYNYIPALNDTAEHIGALSDLLEQHVR